MNKKLFLYLYEKSEKNEVLGKASAIGTKLSYYVFFVIYIVFFVFLLYKNMSNNKALGLESRELFISLAKYILVPFITLIINTTLRKAFKVERPFSKLGKKSLIEHKKSYSFPSNHAACAMVIAMAVIFAMGEINLIDALIIFLAFLTGLSRVMAGVHYPADVLFGWFNGCFLGILGFYFLA